MQIREMGKQVQIIRACYIPEKKRCLQRVVHTFRQRDSYVVNLSLYLTEAQLADLSEAEKEKISDWLRKKIDTAAEESRRSSIDNASANLLALASALRLGNVETKKLAKIRKDLNVLIKVLNQI